MTTSLIDYIEYVLIEIEHTSKKTCSIEGGINTNRTGKSGQIQHRLMLIATTATIATIKRHWLGHVRSPF